MKLVYFNGRGLAETSRLLFAISKTDYEDFRYPLEVVDWATHNMKKDEFEKDKKDGKLEMSLNKLPFLVTNDNDVLCQSKTIERYLAKQFNLMGKSDLEAAHIDSICECVKDFKSDYQTVRKSENKDEAMQKWFGESLVQKLANLEKLLTGIDGFAIGSSLSLADITLYTFLVDFFDDKEGIKFSLRSRDKLNKIIQQVSSVQEVNDWLTTRPKTPF